MPELPEVEGFRKYVQGTSLDQAIAKVEVQDAKVLKDSESELVQRLQGNAFASTDRVGKYMFLNLQNGGSLMMHFGMTGSPRYFSSEADAPRHARVTFRFESGFALAFNCPRKFGRLALAESMDSYCQKHKIGTDAAKISQAEFTQKLMGRKSPIKSVLMNQKLLAGVGNWIADEVLYQARMHPEEKVTDLNEKELANLYQEMKMVLDTALDLEAHMPDFPENFMVHSRWTDKGRPDAPRIALEKITVGGRSTYFDPEKQKRKS